MEDKKELPTGELEAVAGGADYPEPREIGRGLGLCIGMDIPSALAAKPTGVEVDGPVENPILRDTSFTCITG